MLLACAALPAGAATASADTTIGSSLGDPYEATFGGTGAIAYQVAAATGTVTAPGNGLISSWSVRSGDMGAEYRLRVLRPSAGKLLAVGTSPAQKVPDAEDQVRGPFAVSLPVKAGDRIALEVVKGLGAPINNTLAPIADEMNYVQAPLAEGASKSPALEPPLGGSQELLLSANFKPAPVNVTLPSISGEARAGTTLQAEEGSWENATSYAFQWLRCLEGCTAIAGATGREYTPGTPDEGKQLRLDVTASGEGGSTTASSALTAGVKPAPAGPPVSTIAPTVSGEARETETLTGTNGSWAGAPTKFDPEWLRCATPAGTSCTPIPGATSLTYVPVHADVGSTLRLRITATNGIGPAAAESAPTKLVQPLVVKAVLTVSPNELCTGHPVQLDSTGSKTPNPPIVKYRYSYKNVHPYFFAEPDLSGPVYTLYEGSSPSFTQIFTWNRVTEAAIDGTLFAVGTPARDFVVVTLTVTDLAGDSASVSSKILEFNPLYAEELSLPQYVKPCKLTGRPSTSLFGPPLLLTLLKGSVSTTMRCRSVAPCAGSLAVLSATGPASRLARTTAARRSAVIATIPFFAIPSHHSQTLRAKLTRAGKRMLRHAHSLQTIIRVTTIEPSGAKKTRSSRVLLRRR